MNDLVESARGYSDRDGHTMPCDPERFRVLELQDLSGVDRLHGGWGGHRDSSQWSSTISGRDVRTDRITRTAQRQHMLTSGGSMRSLNGVDIEARARKHGVSDDDMLHALRHHWRAFDTDDPDVTMFIGPSANGEPLEVGVVDDAQGVAIIHAMPARSKFLKGWWTP